MKRDAELKEGEKVLKDKQNIDADGEDIDGVDIDGEDVEDNNDVEEVFELDADNIDPERVLPEDDDTFVSNETRLHGFLHAVDPISQRTALIWATLKDMETV